MVLQDDIDGKEYKVAMTMILVIVIVTVTVMMTWMMTMTVLTGWAMTVLIYDNNHLGQGVRLIMMMAMSTEMMILMWLMMKAM